jgi:hypothetical protein
LEDVARGAGAAAIAKERHIVLGGRGRGQDAHRPYRQDRRAENRTAKQRESSSTVHTFFSFAEFLVLHPALNR